MNEKQNPQTTKRVVDLHESFTVGDIAAADQALAKAKDILGGDNEVTVNDIFPDADGPTGAGVPLSPKPDTPLTFDTAPLPPERKFEDDRSHREPGELAAAAAVAVERVPVDA